MQNTIVMLLSCLAAVVLVPAATGCSHSCAEVYLCPPESVAGDGGAGGGGGGADGGTGDACPEDPAGGPVAESCGVWVSALHGEDASPGTQSEPVRTLGKAIELAKGERRIYACGGDAAGEAYDEAVALPPGTSLHGGFDCAGGWVYAGFDRRVHIAPSAPGLFPLTLLEGDRQSFLTDVEAAAADAVDPGGSSIAVLALDGSRAIFRRARLVAGNGADGLDGADGLPAQGGVAGNDGADACSAEPGDGGEPVARDCGGVTTMGGEGGDGGEMAANGGLPGTPAPTPNVEGYGAGGKPADPAQGTSCTPGLGGAPGTPGDHGEGAATNGRLTEEGYVGTTGANGAPGAPGQGGGGGGASAGNAACGVLPPGGAGGGSGGSGGCGGLGGMGGQAGGSSFGLAARKAVISLHETEIVTGDGGRGGDGGGGQPGAQGGLPGLGGLGFGGAGGVQSGCAGGAGGNGGHGGHGGGGRGGHTVSVGKIATSQVSWLGPQSFSLGVAGKGGESGGLSVTRGQDGSYSDSILLEP